MDFVGSVISGAVDVATGKGGSPVKNVITTTVKTVTITTITIIITTTINFIAIIVIIVVIGSQIVFTADDNVVRLCELYTKSNLYFFQLIRSSISNFEVTEGKAGSKEEMVKVS